MFFGNKKCRIYAAFGVSQTPKYGLIQKGENSYYPSFRELISYSIRRGVDGFSNPFDFFGKQKAHSRQICNAYFLNLNLDYAAEFQKIKDKKKGIENYKSAAKLVFWVN